MVSPGFALRRFEEGSESSVSEKVIVPENVPDEPSVKVTEKPVISPVDEVTEAVIVPLPLALESVIVMVAESLNLNVD